MRPLTRKLLAAAAAPLVGLTATVAAAPAATAGPPAAQSSGVRQADLPTFYCEYGFTLLETFYGRTCSPQPPEVINGWFGVEFDSHDDRYFIVCSYGERLEETDIEAQDCYDSDPW